MTKESNEFQYNRLQHIRMKGYLLSACPYELSTEEVEGLHLGPKEPRVVKKAIIQGK